tara:strand:+ start:50 stop:562 length:513 start_codon:yes stop_codon:yes gene_type:complete
MSKKKKKKKIKKSLTSKKQRQGLRNFSLGGFEKNPFLEAAKVKNYKQLKEFIEEHTPALGADGVAYAAVEFVFRNYNVLKIAHDPDCHDAVFELLDEIDKKKGGAVEVWKRWKNNPYFHRGLARFSFLTGYKVPKTHKTFQEQVTMFKKHFNLNRKKKKVAQFLDKEFKI